MSHDRFFSQHRLNVRRCPLITTGDAEMGFFSWHRQQTLAWQQRLGLDDYQLLWIAFFKGLVWGAVLTWWLG